MPEVSRSRFLITAGWEHAPHLDDDTKRDLLDSTPPHLRDARSKGTPSLGAGAIYPIPESEIRCDPFVIPAHYKRGYALDVGWNRTACLWGAEDPDTRIIYLYAEYYAAKQTPLVHAGAIKARGEWIKGCIDPAARGRAQRDGEQLVTDYKDNQGLKLVYAKNEVHAALDQVWLDLSLGKIKVFSNLQNYFAEYRLYRRDENGSIVKKHDHLMDCKRYLRSTWSDIAGVQPAKKRKIVTNVGAADKRTGY